MYLRRGLVLSLGLLCGAAGCGGGRGPAGGGRSFPELVKEAQRLSMPSARAARLMDIAAAQRAAQDRSGAEDTLGLARKACEDVAEPADQAKLLAQLALEYARCQNHSTARPVAALAKAAQEKVPLKTTAEYRAAVEVLTGLAETYHALGESNDALRSLQQAETLAMEMKPEKNADRLRQLQVEHLIAIASTYQAIDKRGSARQAAAKALELAREMTDPRERGDTLGAVAALQDKLKLSDAEETFELAGKSLQEAQQPLERAHGLVILARNLLEAGRREQATGALNKAEQLADKVKDSRFREELLTAIRKARPRS